MNLSVIKVLAALLLWSLLNPFQLQAQDENLEEEDLPSESIEVVKLYEPILEKGQKVEITPVLEKTEKQNPVFNDYRVPNRFLSLSFDPPGLRPLAIKAKRSAPLDHFWLRLGAGSIPLADAALSYSSGRGNNGYWGFDVSHLSTYGKSLQDLMENHGDVYGRFNKGNTYFESEVRFDNRVHHRYAGIFQQEIPDSLINKADYRTRFNTIGAQIGFGSNQTEISSFDYDSDLSYHHLWDNTGGTEDLIAFSSQPTKHWDSGLSIGLPLYADYYIYKDSIQFDSTKVANTTLQFRPTLAYRLGGSRIELGATSAYNNEEWFVAPYVHAEVELVEKAINVYATWEKEALRNTVENYQNQNPWISAIRGMQNSSIERRIAGVRGDLGGHFSFDISGGQYLENEKPLFINSYFLSDTASYQVVYDSTITAYGGHIALSYHQNERLGIHLGGSYFDRSTNSGLPAWHLPSWQAQLGAEYRVNSKLKTELLFFMRDKLPAVLVDGTIIELSGMVDFNLAAEYNFSDRFGLYLKLNNVLSRKNSRYNYYPSYGFFAIGGLQLKF